MLIALSAHPGDYSIRCSCRSQTLVLRTRVVAVVRQSRVSYPHGGVLVLVGQDQVRMLALCTEVMMLLRAFGNIRCLSYGLL